MGLGEERAAVVEAAAVVPSVGIGMVGHGFMGRAHAHAYRTLAHMTWPPPLRPELVLVSGRTEAGAADAAARFGFTEHTADWRDVVADPRVAIVDNVGPNHLHAEPTIAAARAGKHVICEKPLGRSAEESHQVWREVAATGVQHLCAFNYRFVPAVRLAHELIAAGEIGEVRHFRARYLQDWGSAPAGPKVWRFDQQLAGSGALGDLGAHIIDLARHLVGEISSVSAVTRTFVGDRPGGAVDVDDAFEAVVEFDHGAVGTLEASRTALGRKNQLTWEINGTKGSIVFDLERLNELQVHLTESTPGVSAQGFRTVLVSEPEHPYWEHWWPQGHMLGWEHSFVHELHHLLTTVRDGSPVTPVAADFEDGYRAAEVCDAILRSATSRRHEEVRYRGLA